MSLSRQPAHAQVGSYYNLISEREHQVSMKLKLGEMWDHNGT